MYSLNRTIASLACGVVTPRNINAGEMMRISDTAASLREHRQTAFELQAPSAWASPMKSGMHRAMAIGVPTAVDEPM